MDNLIIRQEQPSDHKQVFHITEEAFRQMEHADGDEQFLVGRLRNSSAFIPELSLVAELNGQVIGHIMFTRIQIQGGETRSESLILAPVSVLPQHQKNGIGAALIREGHSIARQLGFRSVVLVGHENYYPRFGYELCSKYNISFAFDVPEINAMVISLDREGLNGVSGIVEFPKEFFKKK